VEKLVRARRAALLLAAAMMTACARAPVAQTPAGPAAFSLKPLQSPSAQPSPFLEVRAGHVRAVIPQQWDARPLAQTRYPQEGFVASPRIEAWERGVKPVQGMEAFWIDVGKMTIPSDYYYLAARSPALGGFDENRACRPVAQEIVVDHPPDLSGRRFSPGDYVARVSGVCGKGNQTTRWAYVVVAPGFGPVRDLGIPTSGLYVVLAVVSGHRVEAEKLLDRMVHEATFGGARISDIVEAAGRLQ
jgi:hypothetical protein